MKKTLFISHRSVDAQIADMIKDFLIAVGVPNSCVFCSSLPGNDIDEKIASEVREKMHDAVIDILILSKDYYESPYCLNEAGVAWYQDNVVVIPFGLPEIEPRTMMGFLNSEFKLRRLDNESDIAYLYDMIHKTGLSSEIKYSVIVRETQKLKSRYEFHIGHRAHLIQSDNNRVSAHHIVEIKGKLESLVDLSEFTTNDEKKRLITEPWHKFKCHSIVLKDELVENPDFGNGLIKREPFNFYDEGLLVVNSESGKTVKVKLYNGEIITTTVYIVDEIPFRNISEYDECGSVNNPFPTLYCKFQNGHTFAGKQYIDMNTAVNYKESQIVH